MALEETVDTLEGIDEAYHDLYVENSDGKFEINISGLQSALTKERSARKKLEKQSKGNNDPSNDELKKQFEEAQSTIKNMKVGAKVRSAALSAGVDPEYIDDVMALTKGNFGLDDKENVIMVDADGDPTGKSVEQYFTTDYKKNKPRFYNKSGKTGSGSQTDLLGADPNSYDGRVKKAVESKDTLELIRQKNKKIKK